VQTDQQCSGTGWNHGTPDAHCAVSARSSWRASPRCCAWSSLSPNEIRRSGRAWLGHHRGCARLRSLTRAIGPRCVLLGQAPAEARDCFRLHRPNSVRLAVRRIEVNLRVARSISPGTLESEATLADSQYNVLLADR
jgi:hypothetical protein